VCIALLLMLFSVHYLISWLDGTVMSVGRSSSSHAHLQTFQNSCIVSLCIWYCVVVISITCNCNTNHDRSTSKSTGTLLNVSCKSTGNFLGRFCRQSKNASAISYFRQDITRSNCFMSLLPQSSHCHMLMLLLSMNDDDCRPSREMGGESNLRTANMVTNMTDVGRCSIGVLLWGFCAMLS